MNNENMNLNLYHRNGPRPWEQEITYMPPCVAENSEKVDVGEYNYKPTRMVERKVY